MEAGRIHVSPSDPSWLEPGKVASKWFNQDWFIVDRNMQTQRIKTRVDSCSDWSMIQSSTVESLGLEQRPLLKKMEFEGIFGGIEVATHYVDMYISCPAIGQEVVKWQACVVGAPGLEALLLGSNFDDKYHVFR